MAEKYIMLHCGKDQATEVLQDGLKQGVERGLFIRSQIGKQLNNEFDKIKKRGYFPIGIIIDDSFNVEILFNRHPKQSKEMRMTEIETHNPHIL
jgi:hypothetical protein